MNQLSPRCAHQLGLAPGVPLNRKLLLFPPGVLEQKSASLVGFLVAFGFTLGVIARPENVEGTLALPEHDCLLYLGNGLSYLNAARAGF